MGATREQRKVIRSIDSVISLQAGHGTGKTWCLARFVRRKLESGKYRRIIVVTYTKSATKKMRKELAEIGVFGHQRGLSVGTFHSFAFRELKKNFRLVDFKNPIKGNQTANKKVLRRMLKKRPKEEREEFQKQLIRINQDRLRSGKSIGKIVRKLGITAKTRSIKRILNGLREKKKAANMMDFDDTIFYFWKMLKDHPERGKRIARRTLIVMDEFQDTTHFQWKAINLLISYGMHFLGAGDRFQTIYRFAGASFDRFSQLEAIPGCRKLSLRRNRRTTQQIINLSNALLSQCRFYDGQGLFSTRNGTKPIVYLSGHKGMLEMEVNNKIRKHVRKDRIPLEEMAVLFRFDNDGKSFRKTCIKENIPFVYFGRDSERTAEISGFVLSVIRIAQRQGGANAWRRVLSLLSGINKKGRAMKKILNHLKANQFIPNCLVQYRKHAFWTDLGNFLGLLTSIQNDPPVKAVSDILSFYRGLKKAKKGSTWSNEVIAPSLVRIAGQSSSLEKFIENWNDPNHGLYHEPKGYRRGRLKGFLNIANIHRIKGGEKRVVFIIGTYDRKKKEVHTGSKGYQNAYEFHKTFEDDDAIQEEILIMNTAITRSQEYLYFMFPMSHDEWESESHQTNPSIFIRRCKRRFFCLCSVTPRPNEVHPS